ncbi:hypothetical protein [Nocardioides marmoraquaticus]
MSETNTLARSLHDVGLAAWFGGSLMGAVGLNGATAAADDPTERTRLSTLGWARWSPVNAVAIGAHLLGGARLTQVNKGRVATQPGAGANTATKLALTAAAAALTAYAGAQGKKVGEHAHEGAEGATEPAASSSRELEQAQQRLRAAQWAIPALTGALLVLAAEQGEQQRPQALVGRQLDRLPWR